MLSKGTAEVLDQVLDSESRCSDGEKNDSDDDSVFHPSDVSDDDDDDDSDILWEAEPKNNTGSKIFSIFTIISNCI